MFNTGTVVGIGANIFGCGFPRNFIPSFSWGGSSGLSTYKLNKLLQQEKFLLEEKFALMIRKRIFFHLFMI